MMLSRFPMGGGGAEIEFASGSLSWKVTAYTKTITITGLTFKPISVFVENTTASDTIAIGMANPETGETFLSYGFGVVDQASANFTTADGGFTITIDSQYNVSTTANWYAIGY